MIRENKEEIEFKYGDRYLLPISVCVSANVNFLAIKHKHMPFAQLNISILPENATVDFTDCFA